MILFRKPEACDHLGKKYSQELFLFESLTVKFESRLRQKRKNAPRVEYSNTDPRISSPGIESSYYAERNRIPNEQDLELYLREEQNRRLERRPSATSCIDISLWKQHESNMNEYHGI